MARKYPQRVVKQTHDRFRIPNKILPRIRRRRERILIHPVIVQKIAGHVIPRNQQIISRKTRKPDNPHRHIRQGQLIFPKQQMPDEHSQANSAQNENQRMREPDQDRARNRQDQKPSNAVSANSQHQYHRRPQNVGGVLLRLARVPHQRLRQRDQCDRHDRGGIPGDSPNRQKKQRQNNDRCQTWNKPKRMLVMPKKHDRTFLQNQKTNRRRLPPWSSGLSNCPKLFAKILFASAASSCINPRSSRYRRKTQNGADHHNHPSQSRMIEALHKPRAGRSFLRISHERHCGMTIT